MTHTLPRTDWLLIPALAAAALFGALTALQPLAATALMAVAVIGALAFLAPATHLAILVFLTTIVPYSVSNRYGAGAGSGSPGLLASDLFLLTGLARAAVVLPRSHLDHRRICVLVLVTLFCAWALIAAYLGARSGHGLSDIGQELRTLAGFGTAIVAIAVLLGQRSQERMVRAFVVLGLLLGLWGMAQWQLNLPFATDFGVREGVSFTESGRGQIQGGLFAFPIAVILAAGVLMTGEVRRGPRRTAVIAILALNSTALLLTFERTFWVATMLGIVAVALRNGRVQRGRTILWAIVLVVVSFAAVAAVSPVTLQTARERLLSIGQYANDSSLRYRRVESAHVLAEIERSPIAGSGLAASIWWGKPWLQTPPTTETYSHNGYLWLVWKLGSIGAFLLLALFLVSICWRGPPDGGLFASVRVGCQASLLALLVASVTFPTFSGYGITAAMGVLIAVCAMHSSDLRRVR